MLMCMYVCMYVYIPYMPSCGRDILYILVSTYTVFKDQKRSYVFTIVHRSSKAAVDHVHSVHSVSILTHDRFTNGSMLINVDKQYTRCYYSLNWSTTYHPFFLTQ